jgi:hypothetical protein
MKIAPAPGRYGTGEALIALAQSGAFAVTSPVSGAASTSC